MAWQGFGEADKPSFRSEEGSFLERWRDRGDQSALGERRDLNPRVAESQSAALPLGYARQSCSQVYLFFRAPVNFLLS